MDKRIAIGAFAVFALATACAVYFIVFASGGARPSDDTYVHYEYTVSFKGLDNYNNTLFLTDVAVPVPVKNNRQVFSDDELQYQPFGEWSSVLMTVGDKKMLGLQTFRQVNDSLTDIEIVLRKNCSHTIDAVDMAMNAQLYPLSNASAGNGTLNYTTCIYIDSSAIPTDINRTIRVNLTLLAEEFTAGVPVAGYRVEASGWIPCNRTGIISLDAKASF